MPKNEEKEVKRPNGDYETLAKQIQTEYELAWKHQRPKKVEYEKRLKLYNNQKRNKKAVGDTTMFTKCDKEGCECEECVCK